MGEGLSLPSEDPQSESDVFVFWDNKLRRQSGGRVGAGSPGLREGLGGGSWGLREGLGGGS